jgi:hypothetical protein
VLQRWHANLGPVVGALREAANESPADDLCAAALPALEKLGVKPGSPNWVANLVPQVDARAQAELMAPLLALEIVNFFLAAEGLHASCGVDINPAPPAFMQRVGPLTADSEPRRVRLSANGKGGPGSFRFTVKDPASVAAVWLSLSGAVKRGHVLRIRLNKHWLAMGGEDPGPGRELRRGIPPHLLAAGENRLVAEVLGLPAGAIGDADTLEVTLRLPSP